MTEEQKSESAIANNWDYDRGFADGIASNLKLKRQRIESLEAKLDQALKRGMDLNSENVEFRKEVRSLEAKLAEALGRLVETSYIEERYHLRNVELARQLAAAQADKTKALRLLADHICDCWLPGTVGSRTDPERHLRRCPFCQAIAAAEGV